MITNTADCFSQINKASPDARGLGEVPTFDGEHGAGYGVQGLIRYFAGLIQLHIFQRQETFPAFSFNIAALKNKEPILGTKTCTETMKVFLCKHVSKAVPGISSGPGPSVSTRRLHPPQIFLCQSWRPPSRPPPGWREASGSQPPVLKRQEDVSDLQGQSSGSGSGSGSDSKAYKPPSVSLAVYLRSSIWKVYSETSSGWQLLMVSVMSCPSLVISTFSEGLSSFSPFSHFQFGVSLKSSHLNVALDFGFTCWSLRGLTSQSLMISGGLKWGRSCLFKDLWAFAFYLRYFCFYIN